MFFDALHFNGRFLTAVVTDTAAFVDHTTAAATGPADAGMEPFFSGRRAVVMICLPCHCLTLKEYRERLVGN